jgi:hypothetical protein
MTTPAAPAPPPAPFSLTDSIRRTARGLFIILVCAAIAGWLFDKDPAKLVPVLWVVVVAMGVGEASNVGKRATTQPALMPSSTKDG